METNNLRLAQCCGSCVHCNKPKNPSGHIAHYAVAKTQRWCYKNNCYTTRECVCDCYEPISKGGSVSSSKRVFSFNKRLQKILNIIEKMNKLNITEIKLLNCGDNSRILLDNDYLYYAYDAYYSWKNGEVTIHKIRFDGSDTYFDKYEEIINKELNKLENN